MNPNIDSNLKTNKKSTYLENLSLENLEEKLILSTASDMDTDSDLDVSVKSDTAEPHVPRTIVDSVTAVLALQKLATGSQPSTNSETCPGVVKTTF